MAKQKIIQFSRDDKCPICHHVFRSDKCPHSFAYVEEVVRRANSNMDKDVAKLQARRLR